LLPSANTPDNMKITELFKAGTEPTKVSTRFANLKNVSDLKASISGQKVSLQWTGIETPDALNVNYLNSLYSSTCKNVNACTNSILSANQQMLGNVTYQVYLKNSNGSLTLLQDTVDTKVLVSVPKNIGNSATFVVKTSYSKYNSTTSDGVEIKVDVSSLIKEEIKSILNGPNIITIEEGTNFVDPSIKVTEGNNDVTSKAKIDKIIKLNNKEVTEVKNIGTYIITYKVTYKDHEQTFSRTVNVTKKKETQNPSSENSVNNNN